MLSPAIFHLFLGFEHVAAAGGQYLNTEALAHPTFPFFKSGAIRAGFAFGAFGYVFDVHISYLPVLFCLYANR